MAVLQAAASSERRRLHMAPQPTCTPGCHSCCYRMVEITVAEAAVMVASLRETGRWKSVRSAALGLSELSRAGSGDSWFKMRTRCPVLTDENMCGAHEVRPPACSVHFVTSNPSGCDPWSSEPDFSPSDLSDVYLESQVAVRKAVPPGGIMAMVLPMPLALLLADRVAVRTDLTFEQAMEILARET